MVGYCACFVLLCLLARRTYAFPPENDLDDMCQLDVEKLKKLVSRISDARSFGCGQWTSNSKGIMEEFLQKDLGKCNANEIENLAELVTGLKSELQQDIQSAKSSLITSHTQELGDLKSELKSELQTLSGFYAKEVNTLSSDMRWLTSEQSKSAQEMNEKSNITTKEVQDLASLVKNLETEIKKVASPNSDISRDLLVETRHLGTQLNEAITKLNKFSRDINAKLADAMTLLEAHKTDFDEWKKIEAKRVTQEPTCPSHSDSLTTLPNEKKYLFSNATILNWKAAEAFCEMEKMHLASPKTQQELTFLHQKAKEIDNGKTHWWLVSATDIGRKPGEFEWHDGTSLPKNSHMWSWGEPDEFKAGREDCVYFNTGKTDKLWDYVCSYTDSFICEVPSTCL
ncbi:Hypothetical predicted protein [Cloeon dipterum]|uniref:C-type lectin domain-containing protein n=1 Tax=Cloeon dipterum TaxID=197152 RepID=A0A8S1DSF5_9INSE|nr:Hypothetical predicted protein [Cloeon dipterum]